MVVIAKVWRGCESMKELYAENVCAKHNMVKSTVKTKNEMDFIFKQMVRRRFPNKGFHKDTSARYHST